MSISALTSTGFINPESKNTGGVGNQNDATKEAQERGFDYLQLLITQLENQNPLEPMDTKDLTNQLLQQAQLEQSINTNDKLDAFLEQLENNSGFSTLSYIGNRAELLSKDAPVQGGKAEWAYVVDGQASEVQLTVVDQAGRIVHNATGSIQPGAHKFSLDINEIGADVADGEGLTLLVGAVDENGETLRNTVTSFARIDGVDGTGTNDVLTAGNLTYELGKVLKMSQSEANEPIETENNS